MRFFLGIAFPVFSFLLFGTTSQAEDARVESFVPTGVVRAVEQVKVRFTEKMVPLGDLRDKLNPFFVECPVAGVPRWLNSNEWVYDFSEPVPAGIECKFGLRREIRALSGARILGNTFFSFSTGGPKIIQETPFNGSTVDPEQVFVLELDGEVDTKSVLAHASIQVKESGESLRLRLITGADRDAILRSSWRYRRRLTDKKFLAKVILLQAERAFPVDSEILLRWPRTIASVTGVQSSADQELRYRSPKEFAVQFSCTRESKDSECSPLGQFTVNFGRDVSWEMASQVVVESIIEGKSAQKLPLTTKKPEQKPATVSSVYFAGPHLAETTYRVSLPVGLQDDRGDAPVNRDRFPLEVKTSSYPPLAKFAARFGILEAESPLLPLTMRKLEPEIAAEVARLGGSASASATTAKISADDVPNIFSLLYRVQQADWNRNQSILASSKLTGESLEIPRSEPAGAFSVVGIPLPGPGLYVVEVESENLRGLLSPTEKAKNEKFYVPTVALVTDMSVHFKRGIENSLVWVTSLKAGAPVSDAAVTIFNCRGEKLWTGTSDSSGIANVDRAFSQEDMPYCPNTVSGLLVSATKGSDLSFVLSDWNDGIERFRFSLPWSPMQIQSKAHTVFGRSLLRAGETLHMKHYLRSKTLHGFALPKEWPKELEIEHLGSNKKYNQIISWDEKNGVATSEWQIPSSAALGHYEVFLVSGEGRTKSRISSGSVQVEAFRVPLLKGRIQAQTGASFLATKKTFDFSVEYLNGGPARNLPVRVRYKMDSEAVTFPSFPEFSFGMSPLKQGTIIATEETTADSKLDLVDRTLSESGSVRLPLPLNPVPGAEGAHKLQVEMEFRDPNGASQTVAKSFSVFPSEYLVGIRTNDWIAKAGKNSAKVVVVDTSGKAVANVPVTVTLLQRKYYSHRKRLVGGFYSYENVSEVSNVQGNVCPGKTDAKGQLNCEYTTTDSGQFILQASVQDSNGKQSFSSQTIWLAGKESWWFSQTDTDRIDFIPERKEYQPGEIAKLQLRLPFPEASVLVTVEREGILSARVEKISSEEPIVTVPIAKSFAPNVFVSALAVRGRAADPKATAIVDLGKPAYKLGIAQIRVGWNDNRLQVRVSPGKKEYRVREKVDALVEVRDGDGKLVPNAELTIAVVDEGLLELQDNTSWQLLEEMMRDRGYGVENATAQMHVVGKRHFGLKAVNNGGGGGKQSTRELFETLVHWQGRASTNASGVAKVEFPLKDSLSSFRIVAVASSGLNRFGTGDSSIISTQDISVLPGVAPLVRSGDEFKLGATVRNTSSGTRKFIVALRSRREGEDWQTLRDQQISLKSGDSQELFWETKIPFGYQGNMQYEWQAKVGGEVADRVLASQKVVSQFPPATLQSSLTQIQGAHSESAQFPEDALIPGRAVHVSLAESIVSGLDGVQSFMRDYPYSCLEQKISQAIVLDSDEAWKKIVEQLPLYQSETGLLSYFPPNQTRWSNYGSPELTAFVLQMSYHSKRKLPIDRQKRMLAALLAFAQGKASKIETYFPAADQNVRRLIALAAVSRYQKIDPLLIQEFASDVQLWSNTQLLYWAEILLTAPAFAELPKLRKEVETLLQARLDVQGTIAQLQDSDRLWWLMEGPDLDLSRLVLLFQDAKEWQPLMARLVRGLFARQKEGHWSTTTANAWGALAVRAFAGTWEKEPVAGKTQITVNDTAKSHNWGERASYDFTEFAEDQKNAEVQLQHEGAGKPWASVRVVAALPLKEALTAGFAIERTITAIEQKQKGRFSRGDIIRVDLVVRSRSDQSWVVIEDPIPAGGSILGTIGNDSLADDSEAEGGKFSWLGANTPRYIERGFDFYRAYYSFIEKGIVKLSYSVRLNNSGQFQLPATRVQSMYNPEVFAAVPNSEIEVE